MAILQQLLAINRHTQTFHNILQEQQKMDMFTVWWRIPLEEIIREVPTLYIS
jgi:hypothetical protein